MRLKYPGYWEELNPLQINISGSYTYANDMSAIGVQVLDNYGPNSVTPLDSLKVMTPVLDSFTVPE